MKKAIFRSVLGGTDIECHATTDHPQSSYGHAVWVTEDGTAIGQVGLPIPFYSLVKEWEED